MVKRPHVRCSRKGYKVRTEEIENQKWKKMEERIGLHERGNGSSAWVGGVL